jgi:hypothetical protein
MMGRLRIGSLYLGGRDSGGGMMLAFWHPRNEGTWHWSVSIQKPNGRPHRTPKTQRAYQWHDTYWLPFKRQLVVSFQDWHKRK